MAELKIIRANDVAPRNIRGLGPEAGQIRRVVSSEKFFFNVDEVNPGFSPHHWHRHDKYRTESHEVEYPSDFEEIYFILSGRGVIQWKTEAGAIREQEVAAGDTIHMPAGVVEHQLLNNGSQPMRLAVVGVPPPRRSRISQST
ncbi:MAG: cupin domain-containing protein [Burkholderiales bacterium]|nr:cupin domain-containing protein [Burkholderiales bacterium]